MKHFECKKDAIPACTRSNHGTRAETSGWTPMAEQKDTYSHDERMEQNESTTLKNLLS